MLSTHCREPRALTPRHLEDRGVALRLIPDRGDHTFSCADVLARITSRTRAVCISLVQFDTGVRAPVQDIAEGCRQREIRCVVDAAQAMRALQIDAPGLGADIAAGHGYKFCSPQDLDRFLASLSG